MPGIPFNPDQPSVEPVREAVLNRLRHDKNWSQFDNTGSGFDPYVEYVGDERRGRRLFLLYSREVIWQLMSEGVLAPGSNSSNLDHPSSGSPTTVAISSMQRRDTRMIPPDILLLLIAEFPSRIRRCSPIWPKVQPPSDEAAPSPQWSCSASPQNAYSTSSANLFSLRPHGRAGKGGVCCATPAVRNEAEARLGPREVPRTS